MKIAGEHTFNSSREEVWKVVRDPEVLATVLPGTQSLNQLSDTEYEGSINLRIGPVAGSFDGRVIVEDEAPPERCTLSAEAKGSPGFFSGEGTVHLLDQGDGTTLMKYEGEVQIGGKLASVGQRLIDSTSKSMIRQGMQVLDNVLAARASGATDEEIANQVPSEAAFTAAVAKDMMGATITSRRLLWIAIVVVLVLVAAAFIWINGAGGG
jgi:carbon monoxide dehydrogenase subunit G